MKRIIYFIIFVLILTIFISGCSLGDTTEVVVEKGPIPVVIEKVEFKNVTQGERFIGKIKADQNIILYPKTTGKIEKVYVKPGDKVVVDQILMKIEDRYVNDSYFQAELQYQTALTNLTQAEERQSSSIIQADAQLLIAEDTYIRASENLDDMKKKYDDGFIALSTLKDAESAFIQAVNNLDIATDSVEKARSTASIKAADLSLSQANIGLEQAREALGDTKLYAIIAGEVLSVNVEEGDIASPQKAAIQIVNQEKVNVSFNVTENSLINFYKGKLIEIYIPSIDKNIKGRVTYIAPISNEQTLNFEVEVELNNAYNQLKSGMLAETIVTTSDNQEYIVIPTRAVMGTGKDTYVYVVSDGIANKREIEVMEMSTEETILLSGLTIDDQVVIKGQYSLDDGSEVQIIK